MESRDTIACCSLALKAQSGIDDFARMMD